MFSCIAKFMSHLYLPDQNKFRGIYNSQHGTGILNNAINNLPIELHLPGHRYTGPGTKLEQRTYVGPDGKRRPRPGNEPINRVDAAAFNHDVAYHDHQDVKSRNEADRRMLAELDAIQNPTLRERLDRAVVRPIIAAKAKLGIGKKVARKRGARKKRN